MNTSDQKSLEKWMLAVNTAVDAIYVEIRNRYGVGEKTSEAVCRLSEETSTCVAQLQACAFPSL